jgi:hypothetical protein
MLECQNPSCGKFIEIEQGPPGATYTMAVWQPTKFDVIACRWQCPVCHLKHSCCEGG